MKNCWNKHVFTAELPYEKDQVITLFLRDRFSRVDSFVMSLGQMTRIPPSKLYSYVDGNLIEQRIFKRNKLQGRGKILSYFFIIPTALIKVTFDLLRALKSIHFKCDIFFAQHFLPAFVAVILRRMGIFRCPKIIFFMFDFFPIPPEFPRNLYYRGIDSIHRYIRKHVDEVWFTTQRLAECDKERFGPLPKKVTKRLTECCFFRRINVPEPSFVPPLRLAFLGSLRIDNGEEIGKIFSTCHLGIALYKSDPYSPNWFLTSGKFRRFISQRLPVIISSVPYAAKYIHEYKAGFIVDNTPEDVFRVANVVYNNPSMLGLLR